MNFFYDFFGEIALWVSSCTSSETKKIVGVTTYISKTESSGTRWQHTFP